MSRTDYYALLEEKVSELLDERGTAAETVQYLDRMDHLWAVMTPAEQETARTRGGAAE